MSPFIWIKHCYLSPWWFTSTKRISIDIQLLTNFETFSPVVVKAAVRTTLSTVPMGYELGILLKFELNSNLGNLTRYENM